MRTITIAYWHLSKAPDLKYEHNSEYPFSLRLRNKIIKDCHNKGYSVMIKPQSDGESIWIDKGNFRQS